MKTLECTDRNGKHVDSVQYDDRVALHKLLGYKYLIEKYGKDKIYIFAAEPSRETAIGPARIPSPRRFSLHD